MDVLLISGYAVEIYYFNAAPTVWTAVWKGSNHQQRRIVRPSRGQLLKAIRHTMKLCKDIS